MKTIDLTADRCPCGALVSDHSEGGFLGTGCDLSVSILNIRWHPSDLLVDEARFEKADREEMRECQ